MADQERGEWWRVDRERPCPICSKCDWCLVAADGSAAICPRTPDGAIKSLGEAGWLHRLRDRDDWRPRAPRRVAVRLGAPSARQVEMAGLAKRCRRAAEPKAIDRLARELGVSATSLNRLGIGWDHARRAWAFPMSDADGHVRGIRLRTSGGAKFAVTGSRDGLFLPDEPDGDPPGLLLVAEGPTDTAALLDLGFAAVGRPSCRGGTGLLQGLVRRRHPAEVAIMADNDPLGQGRAGAADLVRRLAPHSRCVRLVAPPPGVKDARAWVMAGAGHREVRDAIEAARAHRITVMTRVGSRPVQEGGMTRGG